MSRQEPYWPRARSRVAVTATPAPEDARARNERLLTAYLDGELLAARDFLEHRLAHLFKGFLGKLVNPLAKAMYHAIGEHEVRKRIHEQFAIVAHAARDAEKDGLDAAIAKWTPQSLATEEVVHRGNKHHARFPEIERDLGEAFAWRVRAIAPLLAHAGPVEGYEDLVRAVYPDRSVPERVVADHVAMAKRVTAKIRAEPKLLHFPGALVGHLFPVVDDITDWYDRRARSEFDRVYSR